MVVLAMFTWNIVHPGWFLTEQNIPDKWAKPEMGYAGTV
jgi:hypothetical protein